MKCLNMLHYAARLLLALVFSLATSGMTIQAYAIQLSEYEKAWLAEHKAFRMGVDKAYPPFEFIDGTGRYRGMAADYTALISQKLGVTFKVVPGLTWSQVVEGGKNRTLDLIPVMTPTDERRRFLNFSTPYLFYPQVIITRKDAPPLSGFKDLAGKTIAVTKGYSEVGELTARFPGIKQLIVDNPLDELEAVATGRADASQGSLAVAGYLMHKHNIYNLMMAAPSDIEGGALAMGVRKDWPELVTILDKTLNAITQQEHQKIRSTWGVSTKELAPSSTIQLTPEEKNWLAGNPVLSLGYDINWPPVEYADKNGLYQGMSAEYIRLVAEILGITIKPGESRSWRETIEAAKSGRLDIIAAVTRTPQREKYLSFTTPYLSFPMVIITGPDISFVKNLEMLINKKISVIDGHASHDFLMNEYPEMKLFPVEDIFKGLLAVEQGDADAFMGNLANVIHAMTREVITNLKVAGETPYRYDLSIGISKAKPVLAGIMQKALDAIPDEKRTEIFNRWVSITYEQGFDYTLLWQVLTGVALLLIAFTLWNRRLVREIGERKKAEKALTEANRIIREKEEYSRSILDSTGEGVFGIDLQGIVTFVNPATATLLGYAPEELLGKPIHEMIHHAYPDGTPYPADICPMTSATHVNETLRGDEEFLWRRDGTAFPVFYSSTPVHKDEDVIGAVVAFTDISKIKKTEKALRESEKRHRRIFNTITDAVLIIDMKGYIFQANPAASAIYGYENDEFIGLHASKLATPDFYPELSMFMEELIKKGSFTGESINLRKDGNTFFTQARGVTIVLEGVRYFLVIARDISERKRAEEDLKNRVNELAEARQVMLSMMEDLDMAKNEAMEATRAKSDFLANMSHEIRTPMNAIIGMNYLLSQTELAPKQKDYLNKIQSSAKSLLGVINDILDFSKIEAGKLEMESVEFNLDDVLDNLTNLITVKIQKMERLELHFVTAREVPRLLVGDPLRLGQVLINLTNNALKFTKEGDIVITTTLLKEEKSRVMLKFSVKDSGIGMTAKQVENLFQPFTQADTSITRKYGGTGLGLTICHKLVKMMGGEIRVKSEPGQGSVFSFTAKFGLSRKVDIKLFELTPDLRGMKVLVVDDNATSRKLFKSMLDLFSFEVSLAASGEEGLSELENAAKTRPYDLVIMDWLMTGMDGIEASIRIKTHTGLPKIPVIIMVTSYSGGDIMQKAESAGINGFLIKPVNASSLFNIIMQLFDKETTESAGPDRLDQQTLQGELKHILGARILLVEDNEINQQVACEILEQAGFAVLIADNGEKAVKMVNEGVFDTVLMDIQMPVMDGYQAAGQIREDNRFKDLPIIAMTAHAMTGDREKSLESGMNDHITKPIDPDQLFSTLLKWIKPAPRDIPEQILEKIKRASLEPEASLLSDMPGISVTMGLSRLGNNKTLYMELLGKFQRDYTHAAEEIKSALERQEHEFALRLTHSIKGVSGNMGALDAQKAAGDLETAIRDKKTDSLNGLVKEFEKQLAVVLKSMEHLYSASSIGKRENLKGPLKGKDALLELLLKLEPYVLKREAKPAKELMKEITAFSWPDSYTRTVNDLNRIISRYKFKEAQPILIQLIKQLNK